jgi:hypothetical protein
MSCINFFLSINGAYSFKNKEKEPTKKGFHGEAFEIRLKTDLKRTYMLG